MHLSEETITWLKEPSEEPLYELTGILAESSRIYTAANNTDVSHHLAFQSLLDDCLSLEESHLEFFHRINHNPDGELPVYARGELISNTPSTDGLFGPAYRFPSLSDALLHLYFWISLSFVYPVMRHCQILAHVDVPVLSRLRDMPSILWAERYESMGCWVCDSSCNPCVTGIRPRQGLGAVSLGPRCSDLYGAIGRRFSCSIS